MKYLLLLFAAIIILTGCRKDETPDPEPGLKEITRLHFMNDYIPEPFNVIVFISRQDGSLIADTTFNENGVHAVMTEDPGVEIPDTFMVTLVRYDLYWHSLLIRITTFQEVTPSTWAVTGMYPDTIGQATVSFTSVPDFTGLAVYSNQGYYNYTSSTNPQTCMIYSAADDFYVKINTIAEGPRFKWLEGFAPGNHYTLDLSQLEIPNSITIPFPYQARYFEARFWGFADQGLDLGKAFLFDMTLAGVQPEEQVSLYFPPGRYEHYRTHLMIRESFLTSTVHYSNTTGGLPESFHLIDADIHGVSIDGTQVSFAAEGSYDTQKAFLYAYNSNNEIYEWSIYSPPTSRPVTIPDFSPLMSETFPGFDSSKFELKHAELMDFTDVSSYKELLQDIFDTLQPKVMDQLNFGSVVLLKDQ